MTDRYNIVKRAALLGAIAVAGLTAADEALAAPHDGPGPGCVTHIGQTRRVGNLIGGEGSGGCTQARCGNTANFLQSWIQRHRWFGWQPVGDPAAALRRPPFSVTLPVLYDCGGTGTHTFRTRMIHDRCGYPRMVRFSNQIRESC